MNLGTVLQGLNQCAGASGAISASAILVRSGMSPAEANTFLSRSGEFTAFSAELSARESLPHTDRFESGRLTDGFPDTTKSVINQCRALENRFGVSAAKAVHRIAEVSYAGVAEEYHLIGLGLYDFGAKRKAIELKIPLLVTGPLSKTSVTSAAALFGIEASSSKALDAIFEGLNLMTGRLPETGFRRATGDETDLALLVESAVSIDGRGLREEQATDLLKNHTNGLLVETADKAGIRVHRYINVSQDPKRISTMAHWSTDYHSWDNDRFIMTPTPKVFEDFDDVRHPPRMAAHLNDARRTFTSPQI